MSIPFYYDYNYRAVVLLSSNFHEGGVLPPGEGAFGIACKEFERVASGYIVPFDEKLHQLVPQKKLELVR